MFTQQPAMKLWRLAVTLFLIGGTLLAAPSIGAAAAVHTVPGDFATIQAAIDAASGGDTILVSPGTYHEKIKFKGKNVTVTSVAGAAATRLIDTADLGSGPIVTIGPNGTLEGLTLGRVALSGLQVPAVTAKGSGSVIRNNFFDAESAIKWSVGGTDASPTIAQNVFRDQVCNNSGQAVVRFLGTSAPVVADNLFIDNHCNGVFIENTAPGAAVVNNTFYDYNTAVRVVDGTNLTVRNNIFDMGDAALYPSIADSIAVVENNLVWDNSQDYINMADPTGSAGNLRADPLFATDPYQPLRPGGGSPAIDAGSAAGSSGPDVYGNARPMGAQTDIGAVETGALRQGVSGTVTNVDGKPLSQICVILESGGSPVASTRTIGDGTFSGFVAPGDYTIQYTDCGAGVMAPEWHDNSADQGGAATVTVTAGAVGALPVAELDAVLTCNGLAPTRWGTRGGDEIRMLGSDDVALGLGGDDSINARYFSLESSYTICGGDGNDDLAGSGGPDTIIGGAGDDDMRGSAGNDALFGGEGNDTIDGHDNADVLDGGPGDDFLDPGDGVNSLDGGAGADTVTYREANSTMDIDLPAGTARRKKNNKTDTVAGIENVIASFGKDRIIGNDADNVIDGRGHNDYIEGGPGNDTITTGEDAKIFGGPGDDTITVFSGTNILDGGDGDDVITGGSDSDTIRPGGGNDTVEAGFGNDTVDYSTLAAGVSVNLLNGTATDTGTDTLVDIENVTGSPHNDNLVGDNNKNVIKGAGADDFVNGRGGPDDIYGGIGNDVLLGGAGNDKIYGQAGNDNIDGGLGEDRVEGNKGDDVVDGGDHADEVRGHAGRDTLFGGAGNDEVIGYTGADTISGGSGADYLRGLEGADTINGDDGNDLIQGDDGKDRIDGGAGDDQIEGSNGNDRVFGGGGNDLILGGMGNDRIFGQAGHDTLAGMDDDDIIKGGPGEDTASFWLARDPLTVDLVAQTATGRGNDTMASIEWVVGGQSHDTIIGTAGVNILEGRDGRDIIIAGAGDDFIGGFGGNDDLRGEAGDDFLDGGAGADLLNGGTGFDTCLAGESHISCEDTTPDVAPDQSTGVPWVTTAHAVQLAGRPAWELAPSGGGARQLVA